MRKCLLGEQCQDFRQNVFLKGLIQKFYPPPKRSCCTCLIQKIIKFGTWSASDCFNFYSLAQWAGPIEKKTWPLCLLKYDFLCKKIFKCSIKLRKFSFFGIPPLNGEIYSAQESRITFERGSNTKKTPSMKWRISAKMHGPVQAAFKKAPDTLLVEYWSSKLLRLVANVFT